jgi:hypothetical protein
MTVSLPSYKELMQVIADIGERARDDVREVRDDFEDFLPRERTLAIRKCFRRSVYRHAIQTCWLKDPSLIDRALTYVDRYAIEDDFARCFIRRGCADDEAEHKRALLVACIYYHVTHPAAR